MVVLVGSDHLVPSLAPVMPLNLTAGNQDQASQVSLKVMLVMLRSTYYPYRNHFSYETSHVFVSYPSVVNSRLAVSFRRMINIVITERRQGLLVLLCPSQFESSFESPV
jgi:hypothetical protein